MPPPDQLLIAAAFCPHPPLLVPEVAQGAAGELDALRSACLAAVDELLAHDPESVVLLGGAAAGARFPSDAVGTLAGFGVDVRVGAGDGPPVLPLSLTVGAWLLDETGYVGPRMYASVPASGAGAPAPTGRVVWLVLGDGSACRTSRAPGAYDSRAAGFDAEVARALAAGHAGRLAALDPTLAGELRVAGVGPWRAVGEAWGPDPARTQLRFDDAPYGVGYFVASWSRGGGRTGA